MSCTCADVMHIMDSMFPERYAEPWDNVGLMAGDPDAEVKKILLALDANATVVEEAIRMGADMIITHHPLLFHPLKRIDTSRGTGKIVSMLNKAGITLYSAHTNMDVAQGGVNHALAEVLHLDNIAILDKTISQRYMKLVVFIPKGYENAVLKAMADAGAGWIGNYSHCTFRTEGIGTFKPLEGAHPFIGQKDRLEEVTEVRMETIVRQQQLEEVIKAMLAAHPYEEVAYDVYPLENEMETAGLGIIGNVHQPVLLAEYALYVKECLKLSGLKLVGRFDKPIGRVAVCGGSGGDLIDKAAAKGADVFVTGDIGYHDALKAEEYDMAVIDAGHYATEHCVLPKLALGLQKATDTLQYNVEITVSQKECDPFVFL
ncbi:MAG: hypothetical protein PWQ93_810 [Clostridiales bacterium]|nr:hypothetical protein [Clostridiales bacterium]